MNLVVLEGDVVLRGRAKYKTEGGVDASGVGMGVSETLEIEHVSVLSLIGQRW